MKKFLLIVLLCLTCQLAIGQAPIVEIDIREVNPVCESGESVTLVADYLQTYATNTNNYTVTSIPYAPEFLTFGGTPININNDDDVWSESVALPFPFCFYGQNYTHVLVGSNGIVSFNIAPGNPGGIPGGTEVPFSTNASGPGPGCDWAFSASLPNTGFNEKNAIYGVYQDTDIRTPPITNTTFQNINYYSTGTYPNRVFVANFNDLPQFLCNGGVGFQTSQIILYETTNTIDVLVAKRTPCTTWQGGVGVIGVMNQAGTLAAVPPGRNTGAWSATNEAWRFSPSAAGGSNVTIEWFNGVPPAATSLGAGTPAGLGSNTQNVTITGPTTFTAVATYTRCDGSITKISDEVTVDIQPDLPLLDPQPVINCAPGTFNIDQNTYMLNGFPNTPPERYTFFYFTNNAGLPGTPIPDAALAAYPSPGAGELIWVVMVDNATTCYDTRSFPLNTVAAPTGTLAYSSPFYCSDDGASYLPLPGLSSGGGFTSSPATGLNLDINSGAITPLGSTPGTYTVNYDIAASGSCPAFHRDTQVTINFCVTCATTASNSGPVCSGGTVNLDTTPVAGATYSWSGPSGYTASGQTQTGVSVPVTPGTYTYIVTANVGGIDCSTSSTTVTVHPLPTVAISGTTAICSGTGTTIAFSGTPNATVTYTVNGGANQTIVLNSAGVAALPTGNLTLDTTYALVSVVNTSTTCSQPQAGSAVVTLNPLPVATISGTTAICSGTGTTITFNGTPNATVTYTVNGGANQTIILNGAGTATLPTGNLSADTTYTLVNAINTTTTCSQGQTGSAIVTVNALPTATISGTATICSGTGTTIIFTGTPNATVTYTVNAGANQTIVLNGAGTATLLTGNLTINTTYALVSVANTATTCSQVQTGSAFVTVDPLPTATISGTTAICSGTGTTITFNGTSNATVTYTVNSGANQTIVLNATGTATLPTGNLSVNTTYALVSVAYSTGSCSNPQTGNAVVTVNSLPTATISISGATTICSGTGTTIAFNGTANATVTYTVNGGANQTIVLNGAGTATLATGNLSVNTTYALVSATNTITTCSQVQTGSAVVTVSTLPTATISGTTAICSGTATTITFAGTANTTVTYTVNGGANQTIVLDAAGTGTLPSGNLTINTTYALVSVAYSGGSCLQPLTGSAVVTVNPLPIATISGTTAICSGTGTTITFNGTANATVTYTVNAGTNQTIVLNGAGTATLATGNLTIDTTYALVSVTNLTTTCSQPQSGSAVVTVNPLPTVSISGGTIICSGTGTNIGFTGTANATVTYTINSGANQIIVLNAAGTATLPTGNLTANTTYTLVSVTNTTTTCSQSQSGSTVVTVNPLPIVAISGGTTICSGTGTNIIFTGTANTTVTYTINGSGANQTIALNAVGTATLPTGNLTANTTYTLVSVAYSTGSCSNPQTGNAVVIVNPLPIAGISGVTTTICSGTGTDIVFNGTANATVTYTINGGASQTIVLNATGTATLPTGNLTANATYALVSATNTTTTCSQPQSGSVLVRVNPLPTVAISGTTIICSGTGANIIFTGTANTVVTYTVNSGGNQSITLNGTGTANLPTGNLTANATYTLVSAAYSGGMCSNPQTGNVVVTVNSLPTASISGTTTVCLNEGANIAFTGTPNATVTYTVNGGTNQTIVLDGAGAGVLATGNLPATATYTLVSVAIGSCSQAQVGSAVVTVSVIPNVNLVDGTICPGDSYTFNTLLDIADYEFEWKDSTGSTVGPFPGLGSLTVPTPDTYSVLIKMKAAPFCELGPIFGVARASTPPLGFDPIPSPYFNENPSITVVATPPGDYEYQIDNGAFQTSNVFTDVSSGQHQIVVRNECGSLGPQAVTIIDYPQYFTPNGDGYHDTWNISALNGQANSKVLIFDRFGKLLKEIAPSSSGWDGTFNGKELPSTDYWFVVSYEENNQSKEFKAHFAMKR